MSSAKISFVGAGSVRFALKLIGDLCKTKGLSGSFVSLMDIDEKHLDAVYNLVKRYTSELGANITFEKTKDLRHSLEGANFVINTALSKRIDEEDGYIQQEAIRKIGEKHGYYRGIDSQEFNMISDYYTLTNYNQLKLFLDVAHAIEEISPNAWLIQGGNPVFEGTTLIDRQTRVKVVGVCHGFGGVYDLVKALKMDAKDVGWQVAGVNHGIWLTRFLYKRKDAYPLLNKWIEEESSKWRPKDHWDSQLSPAVIDMYKFYGKMPIGDTVRNGSWKYHFNLETKKKWFGEPFGSIDNEVERPKYYEELRKIRKRMINLALDPTYIHTNLIKDFPEVFLPPDVKSGEQHIPFIDALTNNNKTRLVLNVPNEGIIPAISKDVMVEVPVLVDKEGIHPEKIDPPIPRRIINMYLIPRVMRMKWALEAFLTGDRRVLEEILLRDPRTRSFEQVKMVIEEILSLPFNDEMRKHYQSR